jgi:peptide chain release factor 3
MKLKTDKGKALTVSAPVMFFADDREIADNAYAGDVIGVPNHGVLRVGDTLSESGKWKVAGIPNFAPEMLRRARLKDPLKAKHLKKALESLAEEGVTQLFRLQVGGEFVIGAVGALQIDVMSQRVADEYGIEVEFEPSPYDTARWLSGPDEASWKTSPTGTRPPWPKILTATWCSSPNRPGKCPIRRRNSPT